MIIDSHQHLWDLEHGDYPWLSPQSGALYRTYTQEEVEPQRVVTGVDKVVLVQAANNMRDTRSMLAAADRYPAIAGVVGWVDLVDPDRAARQLDQLQDHPAFCGVRHLIHDEPDPDWILQPPVVDGLRLLAEGDLTYDVVAVLPRHLEHVPTILEQVPGLHVVIDHLAKPPIGEGGWEPWASLLARAAEHPDCYAKISGLNTAAAPSWTAADLQPYVDHAVEAFGPEHLMLGSDWPVCTLAGGYAAVWEAAAENIGGLAPDEREHITSGTACRFYGVAVA